MRRVPIEDLPLWQPRLGYRLRRDHYRQVELEPAEGHEHVGEGEATAGEHEHTHSHGHGHPHAHGHAHEADKTIEKLRDQLLRAQAEFENFRRRTRREEQQRVEVAGQAVVEQMLPVLDNLNRALQTPGESVESLVSGIGMVQKQFQDVLAQQGLERVDPQGQPFDPNLHEAVGIAADSGLPDNTIVDVFQPGYVLKGKLIRPAMVRVARDS